MVGPPNSPHRRNTAFQSIMDEIDANMAAARMVFSMVSAVAEFERSVIGKDKGGLCVRRASVCVEDRVYLAHPALHGHTP
jgi:hypothetical protein